MSDSEDRGNSSRVIVGLVIVAIGVMMLVDRMGIADMSMFMWGRLWPFILIAMGIARMFDAPPRRPGRPSHRTGGWLLWVGVWGLVSEFQVFGLGYDTSWPLLVIGVGVAMVWRAFGHDAERAPVQGK